jgi:hypothetical protein
MGDLRTWLLKKKKKMLAPQAGSARNLKLQMAAAEQAMEMTQPQYGRVPSGSPRHGNCGEHSLKILKPTTPQEQR